MRYEQGQDAWGHGHVSPIYRLFWGRNSHLALLVANRVTHMDVSLISHLFWAEIATCPYWWLEGSPTVTTKKWEKLRVVPQKQKHSVECNFWGSLMP